MDPQRAPGGRDKREAILGMVLCRNSNSDPCKREGDLRDKLSEFYTVDMIPKPKDLGAFPNPTANFVC